MERIPQTEPAASLVIAAMKRAPMREEENRAAELVRKGDPLAAIPLIDKRTAELRQLRAAAHVLLGCYATDEQRDAAAQALVLCWHRPWRVLACEYMAGRRGLKLREMA